MNTIFTGSAYNMAKFQNSYNKFTLNSMNDKTNPHSTKEKSETQKFIESELMRSKNLFNYNATQKYEPLKISNNHKLPKEIQKNLDKLEMFKEQMEQEKKKMKLSYIDNKLKAGAKLTAKELQYLKKHNPDLYREAIKIKRERELYKKQLAQCKTKKDVEKLQQIKTNMFMGKIKAIKSSNMPTAKKTEEIQKVIREKAGCDTEYKHFKQSEKFKSLPEGKTLAKN